MGSLLAGLILLKSFYLVFLDLETGVWKQEREEVADMGVVMRALFKQIIE